MVKFESGLNLELRNKEMAKVGYKKLMGVSLCIGFILIGVGILCVVLQQYVYATICIIFGVGYPYLIRVLNLISQKRMNQSVSVFKDDYKETYAFDENGLTFTAINSECSSVITAKYSYLYKVQETEKAYVLFNSKNVVHLVIKDDLVEGSLEELEQYFISNVKRCKLLKK